MFDVECSMFDVQNGHMRRLFPLLLAAFTLPLSQALFPGCATFVNGPTQQVRVLTQPDGAQVFLNGRPIGKTPVNAVVSRWGMHRVRIEMEGYKTFEVPLEKTFNDNASANIFIGGVWIVVDALTGAIFQLDVPAKTRAEMLPWRATRDDPPNVVLLGSTPVRIAVALDPISNARKIGQMERR